MTYGTVVHVMVILRVAPEPLRTFVTPLVPSGLAGQAPIVTTTCLCVSVVTTTRSVGGGGQPLGAGPATSGHPSMGSDTPSPSRSGGGGGGGGGGGTGLGATLLQADSLGTLWSVPVASSAPEPSCIQNTVTAWTGTANSNRTNTTTALLHTNPSNPFD